MKKGTELVILMFTNSIAVGDSTANSKPSKLSLGSPYGMFLSILDPLLEKFPIENVMYLAGMTDKALFHRASRLVVKNELGEYEPLEDKTEKLDLEIEDKLQEIERTKDNTVKGGLKAYAESLERDKKELQKNAKKLIDLSHKVLVFLDSPSPGLFNALMPLLSHDRYEVEYEFVDTMRYYDVFLVAYNEKTVPDSKMIRRGKENVEIFEKRTALTSQDLVEKTEQVSKKIYTKKNIGDHYVTPLINQGYIDSIESELDHRSNIYYPLLNTEKNRKSGTWDSGAYLLEEDSKIVTVLVSWYGAVGRPEIQKFAGALQGQRARKGIFITTGSFSSDALEYSSRIDSKIVLIDGKKLVELMIDHNIGVSTVKSYEMKKLDLDYFEEST